MPWTSHPVIWPRVGTCSQRSATSRPAQCCTCSRSTRRIRRTPYRSAVCAGAGRQCRDGAVGVAVILYTLFVLGTGVERLYELRISRSRTRRLPWPKAAGKSVKVTFPWMVALHTALLVGAVVEVWVFDRPFILWLGIPMLIITLACQLRAATGSSPPSVGSGIRVSSWCQAHLAVRRGVYRFPWLRHPNYWVVVIEGIALPMIHTAWITAIVFTVLNAILLLGFRIPTENEGAGGTGVTGIRVAIVGGGPVGLAAALFASRAGMTPVVMEARDHDGDKACGEGLMPGVLPLLDELGLDPPGTRSDRSVLPTGCTAGRSPLPGCSGARGPADSPRRTRCARKPTGMASSAGTHASRDSPRIHPACECTVPGSEDVDADYVLGCDGLHSTVARGLGLVARSRRRGHADTGYASTSNGAPWDSMIEVYYAGDAELYITPVDDQTVGVAVCWVRKASTWPTPSRGCRR
jgi:methyltransferase